MDFQQRLWTTARGKHWLASFSIAGIINITPDSFSDGGRYATVEAALEQVRHCVDSGADMVDLGAESTRPGACDLGHEEEWQRLAPVLAGAVQLRNSRLPCATLGVSAVETCRDNAPFLISVDTFRAQTAREACVAGADIINDVSGTFFDEEMAEVIAQYKPGYVLGHSPAKPLEMQVNPVYQDVVATLLGHFTRTMEFLVKKGVPESAIVLDPCIGFGKTLEHTQKIVETIPQLLALGRPLYFGISRKSFLRAFVQGSAQERDDATQAMLALLALKGVLLHRVHNVAKARVTLQMAEYFKT